VGNIEHAAEGDADEEVEMTAAVVGEARGGRGGCEPSEYDE
jgi:hypothetical protein